MLPNYSAESKTNKSTVPIALHRAYLSRSQRHTCTGVTPWLVGSGSLWLIPRLRTMDMEASCQRQKLGKTPTHYSSQNIFLFPIPSWLPKMLAYSWHLRVFSSSKYMENRASPHEKLFKELNGHWTIWSVFVLCKTLPDTLYQDPFKPFPEGKEGPMHQQTLWLLQYLSHLSIRRRLGKLNLHWLSSELLTGFTTQSI